MDRRPAAERDNPRRRSTALDRALSSVGDRWSLLIVAALLRGSGRFNELLEDVPGIAPSILIGRLRSLEREALVVAEPYSTRPPRFVYALTAAGRELAGALRLLEDWGARRVGTRKSPRHAACGTPMELRWHCPTCALPVEDDEAGRRGAAEDGPTAPTSI